MESIDTNLHPKVKELIDNYQSKLTDIPESHPANIPIEHSIELSDVTPVYDPPRTIAYSQREQISKAIDEYKRKILLSLLVHSTAHRLYQSLNAMEMFAFVVTTGS